MKVESNWVKAELNNLSDNADLAASTLDDASLLMTTRRTAQKEYEKLKEQLAEIKKVEYRKRMALKIAKEKEQNALKKEAKQKQSLINDMQKVYRQKSEGATLLSEIEKF